MSLVVRREPAGDARCAMPMAWYAPLTSRLATACWSGSDVKLDDENLSIIKDSDIMGVVEGAVTKKNAA